jgi:molecular chaperone GrpE
MNGDGDNANPQAQGAPESGTPAPETALSPEERISQLEQELAETKDKLLRALAESENQRQRHLRALTESQRFATSEFARELLNVADNLGRAISSEAAVANDPAAKGVIEGVAATERELLSAFERYGVKRVEPALGDKFDHNLHQAMFELETAEWPPGTVAQVLAPGYVMHDRLLRPAFVGVAKTPADANTVGNGG